MARKIQRLGILLRKLRSWLADRVHAVHLAKYQKHLANWLTGVSTFGVLCLGIYLPFFSDFPRQLQEVSSRLESENARNKQITAQKDALEISALQLVGQQLAALESASENERRADSAKEQLSETLKRIAVLDTTLAKLRKDGTSANRDLKQSIEDAFYTAIDAAREDFQSKIGSRVVIFTDELISNQSHIVTALFTKTQKGFSTAIDADGVYQVREIAVIVIVGDGDKFRIAHRGDQELEDILRVLSADPKETSNGDPAAYLLVRNMLDREPLAAVHWIPGHGKAGSTPYVLDRWFWTSPTDEEVDVNADSIMQVFAQLSHEVRIVGIPSGLSLRLGTPNANSIQYEGVAERYELAVKSKWDAKWKRIVGDAANVFLPYEAYGAGIQWHWGASRDQLLSTLLNGFQIQTLHDDVFLCLILEQESWPRESEQGDKWIFCLIAARIAA